MAVTSFFEHVDGRAGSLRLDTRLERDYTRTFRAVCSLATDGPEVIRLHPQCPRIGSIYVSASGLVDAGAWCKEVRFALMPGDAYTWSVVAVYSTQINLQLQENPLLRPADISWDTEEVLVPAEQDAIGQQVGTTAGERFDPPVETEQLRLVLVIEKNLPSFDALVALSYTNTVNDRPFFGVGTGKVLLKKWKANRVFENGRIFWRHHFEFRMRGGQNLNKYTRESPEDNEEGDEGYYTSGEDAWDTYVLNRGFYEIKGGKQVLIRDLATGQPTSVPLLLDADGVALRPTVGGRSVFAGGAGAITPYYQAFSFRLAKNFNNLPIP